MLKLFVGKGFKVCQYNVSRHPTSTWEEALNLFFQNMYVQNIPVIIYLVYEICYGCRQSLRNHFLHIMFWEPHFCLQYIEYLIYVQMVKYLIHVQNMFPTYITTGKGFTLHYMTMKDDETCNFCTEN